MRHPFSTFRAFLNIQAFAMLPNAIFSTLQSSQSRHTKANLAKSEKCNHPKPIHNPANGIPMSFISNISLTSLLNFGYGRSYSKKY
jgi:hypothetical protein